MQDTHECGKAARLAVQGGAVQHEDTLQIGWTPYTEGKPSKVRQTIRFLDNDRFQWIVLLKDGEEWKQIMDATWKRKQE